MVCGVCGGGDERWGVWGEKTDAGLCVGREMTLVCVGGGGRTMVRVWGGRRTLVCVGGERRMLVCVWVMRHPG